MHETYEKDCTLQANLCKAPRLYLKVLHPSNNKQSVSLPLTIIHETTTAAIKSHFSEKNNSNDFLRLLSIWWVVSNSKMQFLPNNPLGNSAKIGDKKPDILRAFAEWVAKWQNEKISCFEKFTLTEQTSSALIRALLFHAVLMEKSLDEGYKYILTSRFQSDPLEGKFVEEDF